MNDVGRTDWSPSSVGYERMREVYYQCDGGGWPIRAVADTSSVKMVTIGNTTLKVCRLYQCKDFGQAIVLSSVSAALAPVYGVGRLGAILLRSPWRGFRESADHFVRTAFLMVEYFFAQLFTLLEAIFVSSDPLHGRQWVEKVEQKMNEGLGLRQACWMGLPMKRFKLNDPAFYWMGCYQSNALGILDDNNNITGVMTYGKQTSFKVLKCTQFTPRPWIRAASALYTYLKG